MLGKSEGEGGSRKRNLDAELERVTRRDSTYQDEEEGGSEMEDVVRDNVDDPDRQRHQTARQPSSNVHAHHNEQWIARHSLWLWMRFSITMAFAVGAAIKDGPGVVMGVEEVKPDDAEDR